MARLVSLLCVTALACTPDSGPASYPDGRLPPPQPFAPSGAVPSPASNAPPSNAPGTPGCGRPPARAGAAVAQHVTAAGRDRTYTLVVPEGYAPQTPYPLVFVLHGSGGTAAGARTQTDLEKVAGGRAARSAPAQREARCRPPSGEGAQRHPVVAGAAVLHAKPAAAAGVTALLVKAAVVAAIGVATFSACRYVATSETPMATLGGVDVRERREATTAPTPFASEVAASPSAPAAVEPSRAPSAAPHVPAVRSAEPLAAATSSARLAEEVAQLDRARALVLVGDGQGALVELRRYHHDFPSAQLGREATLLEIDACEKSGQHGRAQELARAFIRANPQSPAAKRLSSTYE